MILQIKSRLSLKLSAFLVLILAASIIINFSKYSDSITGMSIHVLFQSALIYGLIAVFQKWLLIRAILVFIIVIEIFTQLAYGASLSVGMAMSIFSSSPSESFAFIRFNLVALLLSFLFLKPVQIPTQLLCKTL